MSADQVNPIDLDTASGVAAPDAVPAVPVDVAGMTSAERARLPLSLDVIKATAVQHGVCVRPVLREVVDLDTGEVRIVGIRCNATQASKCPACAERNRRSRMQQCREGWHLEAEPVAEREQPSADAVALATYRADLTHQFRQAQHEGDADAQEDLADAIRDADTDLRREGIRGNFPAVQRPPRQAPTRSTRRRQDAPNLPRRKVAKNTIGRQFAGRYRPSTFVTLTLDSYGKVGPDGTPVDPAAYDYRRAARDAVHFASLLDRWWQNLRRVVGWDVQYFGTVEPQRRITPHAHFAVRGSIPHAVIRQVTAATYLQVWWPRHDQLVYGGDRVPVWDPRTKGFTDPDTRAALPTWDQAVAELDEPAHIARFGTQVHSKGILGGTDEAGRHVGYLTKYLTKSITEAVDLDGGTDTQHAHADRLAAELAVTPCSERCAVWLLYGIQPKSVHSRMTPGHCRSKAHRREHLGLPGRRVLVSRRWSGKTLAEHKNDRTTFVREALAAAGITTPTTDRTRVQWNPVRPGDPHVPSRAELLLHMIAQRLQWRAEYDRARLALVPPPPPPPPPQPDVSATRPAAA